ncbi:MAG TPA: hypothetical protein VGO03_10580 [Acidimicrobiia bacterium]
MPNRKFVSVATHLGGIALGVMLVVGALMAGTASATTSSARLTGTWSVYSKRTAAVNVYDTSKPGYRPWTFAPKCATGGCTTQLNRTSLGNSHQTFTLKPTSATTYQGTANLGIGDCLSNNGTVVAKNAYAVNAVMQLSVKKVVKGLATSIAGTIRFNYTRRPGAPTNCAKSPYETASFHGTHS